MCFGQTYFNECKVLYTKQLLYKDMFALALLILFLCTHMQTELRTWYIYLYPKREIANKLFCKTDIDVIWLCETSSYARAFAKVRFNKIIVSIPIILVCLHIFLYHILYRDHL